MLLYEVEGLDGNIKISKTQGLAHAAKEHSKTALDTSCTLDSSNYSQVCTKNTKECLAPDSEGLSLSLALRCSNCLSGSQFRRLKVRFELRVVRA